jgi:sigma-B regulation protein RsbU (phosphoserine phosphatase)
LPYKGKLLGVFLTISIEEYHIPVSSGDRLIFYTDGLLEIKNKKGEILGEERLFEIFHSSSHLKGQEFCEEVFKKAQEFGKEKDQEDDITLLVAEIDCD